MKDNTFLGEPLKFESKKRGVRPTSETNRDLICEGNANAACPIRLLITHSGVTWPDIAVKVTF